MSELVLFLAVERARRAYARGDDLIEAADRAAAAFGVSAKTVLNLATAAIAGLKTAARQAVDRDPPVPEWERRPKKRIAGIADVCKKRPGHEASG